MEGLAPSIEAAAAHSPGHLRSLKGRSVRIRNSLGFVIDHGGCRLANYMPVGPNGSFGGLRLLADKTKIAYATFTAQTVESHRNAHAECAW